MIHQMDIMFSGLRFKRYIEFDTVDCRENLTKKLNLKLHFKTLVLKKKN